MHMSKKSTKKSTKPRRGRPPLPPGEAQSASYLLKARPADMKLIRSAAKSAGVSVGAWIRERCLKSAGRSAK